MERARYCSTCQCHHPIAQMGRIFRRSSSEQTCQTCPDERCSPEWAAWCSFSCSSAQAESFSSAALWAPQKHTSPFFLENPRGDWKTVVCCNNKLWSVHCSGSNRNNHKQTLFKPKETRVGHLTWSNEYCSVLFCYFSHFSRYMSHFTLITYWKHVE